MAFLKTNKAESFRPLKEEDEKAKAQKTSAAMKATTQCCGKPETCSSCPHV